MRYLSEPADFLRRSRGLLRFSTGAHSAVERRYDRNVVEHPLQLRTARQSALLRRSELVSVVRLR